MRTRPGYWPAVRRLARSRLRLPRRLPTLRDLIRAWMLVPWPLRSGLMFGVLVVGWSMAATVTEVVSVSTVLDGLCAP